MATKALSEAYADWLTELYANSVEGRDDEIDAVICFLGIEAENEQLLTHDEAISIAKKILCRGLKLELTRTEVETFLKG